MVKSCEILYPSFTGSAYDLPMLERLQPCLVAPAFTLDLPLLVARASVFPGGTGIVGGLQDNTEYDGWNHTQNGYVSARRAKFGV